jgi:hypothetical protein
MLWLALSSVGAQIPVYVPDPSGSTRLAVRLAKAHAAASRDNAWLALLDLGTDLPYDARGRTRELQPLDLSHDERYLG